MYKIIQIVKQMFLLTICIVAITGAASENTKKDLIVKV